MTTLPAAATPGRPRWAGVRLRLVMAGTALLAWLPEPPLVAAAEAVGELWYRTDRRRAARARANFGRVAEHLAATGAGPARVRRAADDPVALERLVRLAFRHAVRYYLEVARASGVDASTAVARMDLDTPDVVDEALARTGSLMIIGAHFGAIELPVVYLSHRSGRRYTAPMEQVADPALARWFMETRGRVGVRIVAIADARRELMAAIRRGEPVGMVADRDLTGAGAPTPFFGHPAPMPIGPALIAVQTGVPVYVAGCRRTAGGRYVGRMIAVPPPTAEGRRERMREVSASIAGAIEALITDAPEQWWGAFHPIWRDLDPEAGGRADAPDAGAAA